MQFIWFFLYNILLVPVLVTGFYIGSFFNTKMKEGRLGRRRLFSALQSDMAKYHSGKRVLFHCTSAGEWLQALPIIEKLKSMNPDLFVMVSFFSPSGYKFAKHPAEVDVKFYLPLDTWFGARKLFRLIKPDLWIISKFDIWPNHVLAASKMGIPIVITSATLSADSGRDKGLSRHFNKSVYNRISHFFPISEDDKIRFQAWVPDETKYTIAGDTRYDHVFNRGLKASEGEDIKVFTEKNGLVLIAGSSWPADERQILPAVVRLIKDFDSLRVIIVPHELHESHLQEIETVFSGSGLKTKRFNDPGYQAKETRIVIFNTVGMLARLYKQTDIAFVGGSFGKGTHNVMEPAVFSQPVLFGPNYFNSYEAGELLRIGAAFTVAGEEEFYIKVSGLIQDEPLRKSMGEKARDLIQSNIGATEKIIHKLNELYDIIS
jgi:3-deoxy-D-manno-octulosonic-acid transferase